MIPVRNDVDRDPDACGDNQLSTGRMNGLDEPFSELASVLEVERQKTGRGSRLIERVYGFDVNSFTVRQ